MDADEVRLQARFDQINASHRDMIAAVKRTSRKLFQADAATRIEVLNMLEPIERDVLRVGAVNLGDHALLAALDELESK